MRRARRRPVAEGRDPTRRDGDVVDGLRRRRRGQAREVSVVPGRQPAQVPERVHSSPARADGSSSLSPPSPAPRPGPPFSLRRASRVPSRPRPRASEGATDSLESEVNWGPPFPGFSLALKIHHRFPLSLVYSTQNVRTKKRGTARS